MTYNKGKKQSRAVIYIFTAVMAMLPLAFHFTCQRKAADVAELLVRGKDVNILNIPRQGANDPDAMPVQVLGTYGDIFQPNIRGLDRSYDVIILSATIDPLTGNDTTILWTSNLLVRSFFGYASATNDSTLVLAGMKALLIQMTRNNRNYIEHLINYPPGDATVNDAYLAKLCEPCIEEVPMYSPLRYAGIKWFVVLPLFNSERLCDASDRTNRMRMNVRTSMYRVFCDIRDTKKIRFIAIPALAATESLNDSKYYLRYSESFSTIIESFKGVKLPESIERIYLVAWDKFRHNSVEDLAPRLALGYLRDKYYIETKGVKATAYLLLGIFAASFIFWLIREYNVRKQKNLIARRKSIKSFMAEYWMQVCIFLCVEIFAFMTFAEHIEKPLIWCYKSLGTVPLVFMEFLASIVCVVLAYAIFTTKRRQQK